MAHAKDPFEKLSDVSQDLGKIIDFLLTKSNPETLASSLKAFRENLASQSSSESEISPTVLKIQKLLKEYPGFQIEIYDHLKSRITYSEKMGIIDKFKKSADLKENLPKAAPKAAKENKVANTSSDVES